MKFILAIYAVMGIAGFLTAHVGVGLICIACGVFFYWADKEMDKQPKPPTRTKSTMEVLDEYCCECCNPNSPRQVSFSDSNF